MGWPDVLFNKVYPWILIFAPRRKHIASLLSSPLLWVWERNFINLLLLLSLYLLLLCHINTTTSVAFVPLVFMLVLWLYYFHLGHDSNNKMKWNSLALMMENTHSFSIFILPLEVKWLGPDDLKHMFLLLLHHLTHGSNDNIPPPQSIIAVGLLRHYSF